MDVTGQDKTRDPSKVKAPQRVIVKKSIGQEKNVLLKTLWTVFSLENIVLL